MSETSLKVEDFEEAENVEAAEEPQEEQVPEIAEVPQKPVQPLRRRSTPLRSLSQVIQDTVILEYGEEEGEYYQSSSGSSGIIEETPSEILPFEDEISVPESITAKYEDVDLFFLKTAFDPEPEYEAPQYQPDQNKISTLLDLSLIKGDLTVEQRNNLRDTFKLLCKAYEDKQENIRRLTSEIKKSEECLKKQKELADTFQSLPDASERNKQKKLLPSGQMAIVTRMNMLLFQNKAVTETSGLDNLDNEVKRVEADRDFLQNLLSSLTGYEDDELAAGSSNVKKQIKIIAMEIDKLKDEIVDEEEKIMKVNQFIKGEEQRNEKLSKKLQVLEQNIEISEQMKKKLNEQKEALITEIDKIKFDEQNIVVEIKKLTLEDKEYRNTTRKLERKLAFEEKGLAKWGRRIAIHSRETELLSRKVDRLKDEQEGLEQKQVRMIELINEDEVECLAAFENIEYVKKIIPKLENEIELLNIKIKKIQDSIRGEKGSLKSYAVQIKTAWKDLEKFDKERKVVEEEIEVIRQRRMKHLKLSEQEEAAYLMNLKIIKDMQNKQWDLRRAITEAIQVKNVKVTEVHRHETEYIKTRAELEKVENQSALLDHYKVRDEKQMTKLEKKYKEFLYTYNVQRLERNNDMKTVQEARNMIGEWKQRNYVEAHEAENLTTLRDQLASMIEKLKVEVEEEDTIVKEIVAEVKKYKDEVYMAKLEEEARMEVIANAVKQVHRCQDLGEKLRLDFLATAMERNHRGIKLRDRLEEKAIFIEKIKTFNDMLDRGNTEIEVREDAIKRLKLMKKLDEVDLCILEKNRRVSDDMLNKLESTTDKIEAVTLERISLEKKIQKANRYIMVRIEQAEDPDEVRKKAIEIEERLLNQSIRLAELKMVYDQVTRIYRNLKEKEPEQRNQAKVILTAGSTARVIGDKLHRKGLQLGVEISMMKVEADKAKSRLECSKTFYNEAMKRIKAGLPPSKEIEDEWLKIKKRLVAKERIERAIRRKAETSTMTPCLTPSVQTLQLICYNSTKKKKKEIKYEQTGIPIPAVKCKDKKT